MCRNLKWLFLCVIPEDSAWRVYKMADIGECDDVMVNIG